MQQRVFVGVFGRCRRRGNGIRNSCDVKSQSRKASTFVDAWLRHKIRAITPHRGASTKAHAFLGCDFTSHEFLMRLPCPSLTRGYATKFAQSRPHRGASTKAHAFLGCDFISHEFLMRRKLLLYTARPPNAKSRDSQRVAAFLAIQIYRPAMGTQPRVK